MDVLLNLLIVVFALMFIVAALVVYRSLEKKGILPVAYNPYTNKKKYTFFFNFLRIFTFITVSILLLFTGNTKLFLLLMILTLVQCYILYLDLKKYKESAKEKIMEIVYSDADIKEWDSYVQKHPTLSKDKRAKKTTSKVLLQGENLYISKRLNLAINDKPYRYLVLSEVKTKEEYLIVKYGIFGFPFFTRILYIPNSKKREFKTLVAEIQKRKGKVFLK